MLNDDKKYYIYLRATNEKILVSKEEFDNYYRDINAFRQKQMYHKRCVCPKSKFLDCDMECFACPFHRADTYSLNDSIQDFDGEEAELIDFIADPTAKTEDLISDAIELKRVFERLAEIMPLAFEIGNLRMSGLSDRKIENEIGISRKAYAYQLKKAKEVLKKEFPEFF